MGKVASGLILKLIMSSPFVKAGCVEAFSIAKRAARLLSPRCQVYLGADSKNLFTKKSRGRGLRLVRGGGVGFYFLHA
jgi:hypothetical protein